MFKASSKYLSYILGEGISKGVIFLLFSFFTDYFEKKEFGKLALFWAIIPVLSVFLDFSQRSYVKNRALYGSILAQKSIVRSIVFSTIIALVFYFIWLLLKLYGIAIIDNRFDFYILICAYFFSVIEVMLSYYQIRGKLILYNILYASRNSLPYVLTFLVIILGGKTDKYSPIIFAIVQSFVFGAIALILLINLIKSGKNIFDTTIKRLIKKTTIALSFSSPIIPGVLSALVLSFADRFIINYYYSEVEVAEYTVAYTVGSIFMAFFLATNKMWQKFILQHLKLGEVNRISKAAKIYFFCVLTVCLTVFVFKTHLLKLLSNDSYLVALDLIPIILIGMLFYFLYTVLSNIPFFYKDTFLMAFPAIIAAVLNIILNFLLLPQYGYKVAAYTTTISYFCEFLIIYFICLKKYKIDLLFYAATKKFIR
tara:strand:- start:13722 stop:14996 length:1275 start_codon:yes stop_codon:yes gene_type:complete